MRNSFNNQINDCKYNLSIILNSLSMSKILNNKHYHGKNHIIFPKNSLTLTNENNVANMNNLSGNIKISLIIIIKSYKICYFRSTINEFNLC